MWVSDSTYLPLANGTWAHLCAFKDGCTKHVVDWQVWDGMLESLVTSALQRALVAQRPALQGTAPGLIVHPDRGCSRQGGQYVGNVHKALPRGAKAQLSHSRRGKCDDNTLSGTT